jgi:adenylate kinase
MDRSVVVGKEIREGRKQGGPLMDAINVRLVCDEWSSLLVPSTSSSPLSSSSFIILDGFPTTLGAAQLLFETNPTLTRCIRMIFVFGISDTQCLRRLGGRRVHVSSGRVYHTEFHPPAISDIDDVTGEPLTQRLDGILTPAQ